jgi:mannose-6-phosphate isomerase-like protein (cupin superfamily)
MADYTLIRFDEAEDVLGDYPGEMRFLAGPLGTEQVAVTFRRMPAQTGSKGAYGHRHREQEEVYVVVSGTLQFKLEEDVIDVEAGSALRVPGPMARGIWNEGPDDAELVIVSTRIDGNDGEKVEDFWPA